MLCCIYTLCWKLSQLKCRWFFSSSSDEKSFSLFLIVFSKHITYVSLAAINVCILWTGRFFCIWALCTLSQLLPWFDLRTDALGYKLRCLKVQCIKIFALRNSIVVFLGFLSLHPVFSRCCLFFLWLRLWCDSYRSKMILVFFRSNTKKLFIWSSHEGLSSNRLLEWRENEKK